MSSDFPRILTLLRKEKGLSQKVAASHLDISQSLLSHYEKGIRECGLSFVVKIARFYNVSCDYLLGLSPERNGSTLSIENLKDPSSQKEVLDSKTLKTVYKKKIAFCSLNVLFDILSKTDNDELTNEMTSFLYLAIYRMFRVLFRMNKKNKREMFAVSDLIASQYAQARMIKSESNANVISRKMSAKKHDQDIAPEQIQINNRFLEENYPEDYSALLNLVKNCETTMEY